jgi:hypothetical protein
MPTRAPRTSLRVLSLRLNLFEDLGRSVEHAQLNIPAARLAISFQGIGASWRKKKKAFVATQVISRKAPVVIASIKSDPKL